MINRNNRLLKLALLSVSTVLLASLFLNSILYKELIKYYKLLYTSQLDPLGLTYFQDTGSQSTNDDSIVVFYGDSRAAQWTAPQIDDFIFINRGIGNQTSEQVLLRFEEHIKPLQPDIIVIQVCINDLKTIPLFPEQKVEIIANCETNIKSIIQKSLELDSTIILTTVFPTSGNVPFARRLVWSNDIYDGIAKVNDFILKYDMEGVIVFDTVGILSNTEGNTRSEYVYDLLHLNSTGYDALNSELIKTLEGLKIANP